MGSHGVGKSPFSLGYLPKCKELRRKLELTLRETGACDEDCYDFSSFLRMFYKGYRLILHKLFLHDLAHWYKPVN
jgi:hypothetical protein